MDLESVYKDNAKLKYTAEDKCCRLTRRLTLMMIIKVNLYSVLFWSSNHL